MTAPLRVHLARATAPDVPAGVGWLAPTEARVLSDLRFARRVADWRLGRWVAKRAVAAAFGLDHDRPERIEVLATPGGAPAARLLSGSPPGPISLSLSHSGGVGFAAVAPGDLELGCDVEALEPRSDAFVADYFTEAERAWIRRGGSLRSVRATLLWSAKESALKALGEGLRLDTRSVEVEAPAPDGSHSAEWRSLAVDVPDGRTFPGFWRIREGRVWTVVAGAPIRLAQEAVTSPDSSRRTTGATSVPRSSIARSTSACGVGPTVSCIRKRW